MVDGVKVGQLWRRRLDGRRFIPARRVREGWVDLAGIKRTTAELHQPCVLVPLHHLDPEPEANRR